MEKQGIYQAAKLHVDCRCGRLLYGRCDFRLFYRNYLMVQSYYAANLARKIPCMVTADFRNIGIAINCCEASKFYYGDVTLTDMMTH